MPNKKTCCNCKTPKELSEFDNDRNRKDGKVSRCKPCTKIYTDQKDKKRREAREEFKMMFL